ncbi:hypothetical protein PUN28_017488 [Cardiocondyla obscurior]|uniref:Uncharacterized protein n=1 Tax=Cardiocondyla obscurior TaxID=286306 RepID=A0AAW2EHI2_9HYME
MRFLRRKRSRMKNREQKRRDNRRSTKTRDVCSNAYPRRTLNADCVRIAFIIRGRNHETRIPKKKKNRGAIKSREVTSSSGSRSCRPRGSLCTSAFRRTRNTRRADYVYDERHTQVPHDTKHMYKCSYIVIYREDDRRMRARRSAEVPR